MQPSFAFRQNTQHKNVLSEGLRSICPSRCQLVILTNNLSMTSQIANAHVVQSHEVCWLLLEAMVFSVWLMQIALH